MTLMQFGPELAQAWDEYVSHQEALRAVNPHKGAADKLKKQLIEAFGGERLAVLPDGRILQRLTKTRHMAASEAKDQSWDELLLVPVGG